MNNTYCKNCKQTGFLNFKKAMAILILALVNYLLDIVSPGGPNMFGAWGKILCFGVPRWLENAFPSIIPWTYQCAKAPHLLYYVPRNIPLPVSFKKPTPLPVQLPVQISLTSNNTVLNSGSTAAFSFEWPFKGSWVII